MQSDLLAILLYSLKVENTTI